MNIVNWVAFSHKNEINKKQNRVKEAATTTEYYQITL